MTSLYESSIFTGVSFSGSVADLNGDLCLDLATINPTALFSANHNRSSQSLDQAMAESGVRHDGPAVGSALGAEPTFVCSCCPRAPRHFHTSEELTYVPPKFSGMPAAPADSFVSSNHQAEKPHPCPQCKKRFKSPTEAERHLNALHLKADFWSCEALKDPLLAYHTQTYGGETSNICVLCNGEIKHKDGVPDHDELVKHVETVHRFGVCDRKKKFYRADNFRQHLKGTHVALCSGVWLKELERACRSTTAPRRAGFATNTAGT
jgi:hypothetical protein